MPERANSVASNSPVTSNLLATSNPLASALIAGVLAAAALPSLNTAASAECLENPDFKVTQEGHWYYREDRTLNRRCWHFEPAEAAAVSQAPDPASAAAAPAAEEQQPSPLLQFLAQTFSAPVQQPQQNAVPDNATETVQTISPKPVKPVKPVQRERPQAAPARSAQVPKAEIPAVQAPTPPVPTTNGAAVAERDPPLQAGKNEKREPPSNVAAREALFQDFVKWQLERTVFGRSLQ